MVDPGIVPGQIKVMFLLENEENKMRKLICLLLVLGLASSASAVYVDYAKIDFGNSGTAGTNETQVGIGVGGTVSWSGDLTSLTSDDYHVSITGSGPSDLRIEFKDESFTSGAGDPFTTTQKGGMVARDGDASVLNIAFTGLTPGDYTLEAAAGGESNYSPQARWSSTTGASVSDWTGTANGTDSYQAAWTFTVTSETGTQITVQATEVNDDIRGSIAGITMTYTPEPATIALLGMGSLVLLRRRK